MARLPCLLVVFVFFYFQSAECGAEKKPCKYSDSECLKRAAITVYKVLGAGVPGWLAPIDPLYVNKISGSFYSLSYDLYNATLKGMKDCEVVNLRYEADKLEYEYGLHCPRLVFDYYGVLKEQSQDQNWEGEGPASITTDDYYITFRGSAEKYISPKDNQPRIALKAYKVDTYLQGNLVYDIKPVKGDIEKIKYLKDLVNSGGKIYEKYLKSPILESFLVEFIKILSAYIEAYPVNEIIWDGLE